MTALSLLPLLHAGLPPTPHDLWRAWTLEPLVGAGLVLSAALYGVGRRRIRRRARGPRRRGGAEAWAFWAGWATLVVALVSPIDALGGALFAAHMTQHELLMAVAAPLLVLGRPLVPMLWALPIGARRRAGSWTRRRAVRIVWAALTASLAAWWLHAGLVLLWHLPRLFQATLTSETVHALQHASFLGSALLFWWALLHGPHARRRYGAAVVYLFGMTVVTGGLGALLTVSVAPWYPAYGTRGAAWGLTLLEDQQLGGLIMWIPGGLVYLVAALVLAAGWLREAGRIGAARKTMPAVGPRHSASIGIVMLAIVVSAVAGCDRLRDTETAMLPGADPLRGQEMIRAYGCQSCHSIPGVQGADALVGPPLGGVGQRAFIAGVLPNTPANMVRWIRDPRGASPKTAMPYLAVSERDARDIASYLYRIK